MATVSGTHPDKTSISAYRITAVWALSESALAGILHTLKIPLTGLIMASAAVLFIAMLHQFDPRKGAILKATMLVLLVKALVSPHIPLNAFVAVSFQGLAGEFIFNFLPRKKGAAVVLGIIVLLQSALQKLLVLTIVFGKALWTSIDLFGNFILSQAGLNFEGTGAPELSLWMIFAYTGLHLLAGIFAGIYAANLTNKIVRIHQSRELQNSISLPKLSVSAQSAKNKKRRTKLIPYFIIALALTLYLLSYVFPILNQNGGLQAFLMILRSAAILLIWYFFLAPLLRRLMQGFLSRRKNIYADDLNRILSLLPLLRQLAVHSWNQLSKAGMFRRFLLFPEYFLVLLLGLNLSE